MIFFIADTHFGDDNIRRYENRPFENTEEMDTALMRNWNDAVAVDDEVYLLGDFADRKSESVLALLNGTKYLVKGNHDKETNAYYRLRGFAEVYDKPVILDAFWILSHEPLYVCENMPYANIFGHVHNSPLYRDYSRQHYCVSAERLQYAPISFEDIKKAVSGRD